MSTINFSHLRLLSVFSVVVDLGSFAAAARQLNTSRSRVSEQVSLLEKDMGVRLLQRSTRQLGLTKEGAQIYERARELPEILRDIESISNPSLPSGTVSITMSHDIAHRIFLPKISEFEKLYPQIKLNLVLRDEVIDLIDKQIDLAIRIGISRDDSLISRVVHQENAGLFASPSYLEKAGIPKSIEDLNSLKWILLSQIFNNGTMTLPVANNSKDIHIRVENYILCNSPMMALSMITQGLGASALFPSVAHREIKAGKLVQILPDVEIAPAQFSLTYPSRRHIPSRVRALINFLLEADLFDTKNF